jgi:hypothetical protein
MKARTAIAVLALAAAGCASGGGGERSPLVAERSDLPAIGERGWNFEQTWSADLDGDGDRERVILLAQVERRGDALLWEDGHRWVAYVEEPDSERTYFVSRMVPMGRVEMFVTAPEEGDRRILILERGGSSVNLWEVRYRGEGDVEVKSLAERAIDASSFVGGTRER